MPQRYTLEICKMLALTTLIVIGIASSCGKKKVMFLKNSSYYLLQPCAPQPLVLTQNCPPAWLNFATCDSVSPGATVSPSRVATPVRTCPMVQTPWMGLRDFQIPGTLCKLSCVYIFLGEGPWLWFNYDLLNIKDLWWRSLIMELLEKSHIAKA